VVLSPALRHALLLPLLLAACASDSQPEPVDQGASDVATLDRSLVDGATEASPADASHPDTSNGPCPSLMALAGGVCVDRYEAALQERLPDGTWVAASPYLTVGTRTVRAVAAKGLVPQGYISGTEAAQACAAAGKRLCTSTEWLAACQGPSGSTWPYDATYVPGACNDAYPGHPVVDFFGTSEGVWDSQHMNDPGINQQPGTVAKGGAFSQCVTADGLYDLHGNLHEWVADASGIFRGGFYADGSKNGPGCLYKTTAHAPDYHDYSTGFRCCADPTP
jgi:sulfatase modifying factor 1